MSVVIDAWSGWREGGTTRVLKPLRIDFIPASNCCQCGKSNWQDLRRFRRVFFLEKKYWECRRSRQDELTFTIRK